MVKAKIDYSRPNLGGDRATELRDQRQLTLFSMAMEEGHSRPQFRHDASSAPHVNGRAVVAFAQQQFWRSIPQRYHAVRVHFRQVVITERSGQTKIGQFEDTVLFHQNIWRFQVSMQNIIIMAMKVMESIHKDIVFKKPTEAVRRRKLKNILDEETYVEAIGNIIQRDFFPNLEKLKAQNAYLDALERNDTIKMKELYMKYNKNTPTPERIPSPATFETPANIHNTQVPELVETEINDAQLESKSKESKLSLDQYLNYHTSQDNESFEEILVESERKQKQKYATLYNEEEKSLNEQKEILIVPSIEQQSQLQEKKLNLDTWTYQNRNFIMYVPDGVEMTENDKIELNKKRQEVVHSNTRLVANPFNEVQSRETITELAKNQAKILDGRIGVDGKEVLKDTPKVNGFSFIREPSPSPSLIGTPLMTWGQIEGTPFRLDGSDTPLSRAQGPSFKISDPPKREQLALALAEKVGENSRNQKKKNLDAQRKQFASPSPRPHSSSIDRLATMSPAARKLATTSLRLRMGTDLTSYPPSPVARQKTPVHHTPRRGSTPLVSLKQNKRTEVSTDDLLKINLPSRKKASDFF